MDRFEVNDEVHPGTLIKYLHSSMDRFEVKSFKLYVKITLIYIPVWIDLKGRLKKSYLIANLNLHSSMDRFEGKVGIP